MASQQQNRSLERASTLCLFFGVAIIYLAFLKPGIWGVDGNDMLHMAQSLIREGNFSIPPGADGIEGPDGRFYSIRYPLLSVLAVPLVWLGTVVGQSFNLPVQYTAATCALVLNVALTAATAALVYATVQRVGGKQTGAYLAAVAYGLGTTALVYAREFFAEPLLGFIITLALYLAFGRSRLGHWSTGVLAALAIVAKPAGVLLGPVVAGYFLLKRYGWGRVLAPCIGTAAGVGLFLAYNYVRFGSLTASGQDTSQLGLEGFGWRALGQLVSPGAGGGLFLYCPPTLLGVVGLGLLGRRRWPEAAALGAMVGSFWLLHSGWDFNGWNWGPRFLVPVVPALMIGAGCLGRPWRWVLGLLAVLGFLVNAPTLLTFYQRYYAEMADRSVDILMQTVSLWSAPEQAPLFNLWPAAGRQLGDAFSTPVQEIIANAGQPPGWGQLSKAELLRIVAVWWWFLPAAGIPTWVGVAIAIFMVTLALLLIYQGLRLIRISP